MKVITLILIFLLSAPNLFCQENSLWTDDVQYLKATIHAKYPNLFYNVTPEQFDEAVDQLLIKIPSLQEYEFQAEIGKLMAMFRIGHTQAGYLFAGPNHSGKRLFPAIPVEFYMYSDGLYIKSIHEKYAPLSGAKILKLGDMTINEALDKIRPFVNYENEWGFLSNLPFYLRFPKLLKVAGISAEMDKLIIQYEKNGVVKEAIIPVEEAEPLIFKTTGLESTPGWVDVSSLSKNPVPYWKQEGDKFRNLIYIPESKTCYLRHSVTLNESDKTIETYFKQAYEFIETNDVEILVLDVRMNGGGNNQLNKPIITGIIQLKQINQKGKLFCIIGRRTFSAAQNLVNELERYTEVTFVGEPTSENVNFYGDTRTETLPNSKIRVFCSWLWWQTMDSRDTRKALYPQLSVEMSFADYAANIDPVLSVISNYKEQQSIDDLLNVFTSNSKTQNLNHSNPGTNESQTAYMKVQDFLSNPLNKYSAAFLEGRVNALGYSRMTENKMEEARRLFELNTNLFPQSGNTFDSYAEFCLRGGQRMEALEYYQKALQAEPNYGNADEARKIIKQLKDGEK